MAGAKFVPPMIWENWKLTAESPVPAPRYGAHSTPFALGRRSRRASFLARCSGPIWFTPLRTIPKRASLTIVGDSVDVKFTDKICGFTQFRPIHVLGQLDG